MPHEGIRPLQPNMLLLDLFHAIRERTRDQRNAYQANTAKLPWRIGDVFARTWDLGFTAFGGLPVNFQTLHQRFVEGRGGKVPWIDEQTVYTLFLFSFRAQAFRTSILKS